MNEETKTQAIEGLKKARDLVAKGWIQGTMYHRFIKEPPPGMDRECYCAIGALCSSLTGELYYVARDAIEVPDGEPLVLWNDEPGRTQAEVVALFDKAIASLEDT